MESKHDTMMKALHALYLECPAEVVDSVKGAVADRIAELEDAGRKTLDVLYEEYGRLVVEANFRPLIEALRGERNND